MKHSFHLFCIITICFFSSCHPGQVNKIRLYSERINKQILWDSNRLTSCDPIYFSTKKHFDYPILPATVSSNCKRASILFYPYKERSILNVSKEFICRLKVYFTGKISNRFPYSFSSNTNLFFERLSGSMCFFGLFEGRLFLKVISFITILFLCCLSLFAVKKNRFYFHQKVQHFFLQIKRVFRKLIFTLNRQMARLLSKEVRKTEIIKALEEEIITSTTKLGNVCIHNFIRTSAYKELKVTIQNSEKLDTKKRVKFRNLISITFHPYCQSLTANFQLTKGECFLCCLNLLGFTTNECALIIGNNLNAVRTQKSRIKSKLYNKHTDNSLFNLIFE